MNWYLEVLKHKYATFDGRAHREEFWMFTLVNFGISVALSLVENMLNFWLLSGLYAVAVLVPSIALAVRRLHDTNRSGWWILLWLIPVLGFIVLVIFWIQPSDPGENPYGPNPRSSGAQQGVELQERHKT
jgi:uncharacterized membrane protein YhaH (DUF805 family)